MNNYCVAGNVCGEVTFKTLPSGKEAAEFSVAVNKKFGEKEETSFFTVKCYGFAAGIAHTIGKGDFVLIAGELKQERWDDKDSGAKRSKVVLIAFNVAKMSGGKKTAEAEPF